MLKKSWNLNSGTYNYISQW